MSKYEGIRTMSQLDKAIASVRGSIRAQESILADGYADLREQLSPMNMIAGFVRRSSRLFNWNRLALGIVNVLRAKIASK